MKINRAYWTEKMKVARKAWAALRPDDKLIGKTAGSRQFSFSSYRTIAPGMKYSTTVSAVDFRDHWTMKAWLGFYDLGPATLEMAIHDLDRRDLPLFDVYVPMATDTLERKKVARSSPILRFDVSDDEIVGHLTSYSQDIDRLCQSAGGYDVEGFRNLAKWGMRHRSSTGYHTVGGVGAICAALEYGDRALAIDLLQEVEEEWEENLRREPDRPLVLTLHARSKGIHARLRRLMDLPVPD